MFVGRHAIEVGWGDCDPARIVFFPRYFEWFEICTTAMFRDAGLPLHAMFAERNMVGIPLLDVGARFHFGSGYGHVLEVESRVVEWKARRSASSTGSSATAGSPSKVTRCGSGPCPI